MKTPEILLVFIAVFLLSLLSIYLIASSPVRDETVSEVISFAEPGGGNQSVRSIKVMTYNMGYASGMSNNLGSVLGEEEVKSNLDMIAGAIAENGADIVALQEVDLWARRSCYIDQFRYLGEKLGFPWGAYMVNWNRKYVPYPFTLNPGRHFGRIESAQAVLSRFPILGNDADYFVKPLDKPFWYNKFYTDRGVQKTAIRLPGGETIKLYNVHLEAYHPETRKVQVRELLDVMRREYFTGGIIMGDFNAVPPGAAKQNGFSDEPEIDYTGDTGIRVLLAEGKLNEAVMESAGNNASQGLTFPSVNPSRRLDYIFYRGNFRLVSGRVDTAAGTGSDHLPVTAELEYTGRDK